jgi:uncharacterized protein (DUF849 family)
MPSPAVITVAITGSVPRKKDTPAIPVTPSPRCRRGCDGIAPG